MDDVWEGKRDQEEEGEEDEEEVEGTLDCCPLVGRVELWRAYWALEWWEGGRCASSCVTSEVMTTSTAWEASTSCNSVQGETEKI